MKKIAIIIMTIAMLTQLAGCLTKKQEPSSEDSYTSVESDEVNTTDEDVSSTLATDLPEPDFSQREAYDSPFEFPYDEEGMNEYLIEYANGLGMVYNSSMTGEEAKTATQLKSRSAVNGRVFETWCEEEIDNILSTLGKSAEDVEYNILITESTEYDCEYDITIIAKY